MSIKILSKEVINQISAGEVVERPASIVKELVENSIDAGATSIQVEVRGGGIEYIAVTDNGCGINKDEVKLAFTPHATSKLEKINDLDTISTMGFRGEALATISAVSKVSLITKTENDETGIKVELLGGEEISREEIACTKGTKIEVRDVFYNTPARLKFLRKPKSEEGDITSYIEKLIFSHPEISFKYIVEGKIIYNTISSSIYDIIYTIYGKDVAENVIEVDYNIGAYKLTGYVSKPEFAKANRTYQNLFVNNRFCNNSLVSSAVSNAYENFSMKGKFPLYVLFLTLPQNEVDVNVHPNKLEVKFVDTRKVYQLCMDAIFKALSDFNHIKPIYEENIDVMSNANVSFANVSKNEGVSFKTEIDIDGRLDSKKEDEAIPNSDDIAKFFETNNKNNGSYGFDASKNILTEVALKEIDDTFDKKETNIAPSNQKQEQESYNNLFNKTYSVVGKIFNTYLILEQEDKIYFIDQHAAHERARYDVLLKEIEEGFVNRQPFLVPYTFDVSPTEYAFIMENLEDINAMGIEMYAFGSLSFKISSIPLAISNMDMNQFVGELLKNINSFVKSPKQIIKERLMQIACKSAVKGGDDLKDIEINALLDTLKNSTKVLLCPHGRPIIVEISQNQVEKWFKRIVWWIK